ncbi:hypothetical protein E2C01_024982 [Portunus trituberculatus]|uniref:Uncharacterized protein n=1 Tax=Portunus trituberculatus TaxID=210409 RepID=A0A5B7EES0_PORTR|nr:hypothetical protein [Portunus trituberculatus]
MLRKKKKKKKEEEKEEEESVYLRRRKTHHTRIATRAPREIFSGVFPTSGRWQCVPLNPEAQAHV